MMRRYAATVIDDSDSCVFSNCGVGLVALRRSSQPRLREHGKDDDSSDLSFARSSHRDAQHFGPMTSRRCVLTGECLFIAPLTAVPGDAAARMAASRRFNAPYLGDQNAK
jgi:hypothetical protein